MHPFEQSGLGKPPYVLEAVSIDAGKCDHCGTRIKNNFHLASSDDNTFIVGSQCVRKADKDLAKQCDKAIRLHREYFALTDEERAFLNGFKRVI